jgi:hypothetical protein
MYCLSAGDEVRPFGFGGIFISLFKKSHKADFNKAMQNKRGISHFAPRTVPAFTTQNIRSPTTEADNKSQKKITPPGPSPTSRRRRCRGIQENPSPSKR